MLSLILEYLFKNNNRELWNLVIRNSFFFLNGTLIGILMNDAFRLLFGDFDQKEILEYSISGLTASSGYVFNLPILNNHQNNLSLGSGMALGTFWANMTEDPNPTSLLKGNSKQNNKDKGVISN